MTNEERDIITQFIARVGGSPLPGQPGYSGGSVPATQTAPLPPVDREADALITQQFQRYPEARYRITQLAFVQEHALVEAQNRIRRLEWELQQSQMAAQQAQQEAQQRQQPPGGGGFFGNLFGGNRQAPPPPGGPGPWGQRGPQQPGGYQPPPQPQYPPGYQPGMFQRQGSGFLGSALTTAAGVAGGLVVGNALMSMFSGGGGLGGAASSPWTSPAGADQAAWDSSAGAGAFGGENYADSGGWDQPTNDSDFGASGGSDWGGSDEDSF